MKGDRTAVWIGVAWAILSVGFITTCLIIPNAWPGALTALPGTVFLISGLVQAYNEGMFN